MPQYNVELTETNMIGPMASLKVLYERMPETCGCEDCEEINGLERKQWCCRLQNPSMHYSEFMYTWRDVEKKWSKVKRLELVLNAISTYLDNSMDKGCIFYNSGCQIYSTRPFACHMYGVMPVETWKKREAQIKEVMGEDVKISPQCSLVKLKNDPLGVLTGKQEDLWFSQVLRAEKQLGVSQHHIDLHDNPGGSYRTFHDHLLMELFPIQFMAMLTKVRLTNPSKEDIAATVGVLREQLEKEDIIK